MKPWICTNMIGIYSIVRFQYEFILHAICSNDRSSYSKIENYSEVHIYTMKLRLIEFTY